MLSRKRVSTRDKYKPLKKEFETLLERREEGISNYNRAQALTFVQYLEISVRRVLSGFSE